MSNVSRYFNKRRVRPVDVVLRDHFTSFSSRPPINPRLRTTLVYAETIINNTLTVRDYKYNLNGLFDPNNSGTGHQPKGYDQLSALYQRYRVYQTRWTCNLSPYQTFYPTQLVCVPTNSVTGFTAAADAYEATWAKSLWITTLPDTMGGVVNLSMLNGKTPVAYASDDSTQALVSANPTEQLILHIMTQTLDGSTPLGVFFTIKLEFDVEFSDPVQLAQS